MNIRQIVFISLSIIVFSFSAYDAYSSPPGKTVSWNTPAGNVVFNGSIHAGKGMRCMDCHQDSGSGRRIFEMRKNSFKAKHTDLDAGRYCGQCHNGTVSFSTSDKLNCSRCHKK